MAQLFRRVSTPEKLLRFLEAGQTYVHANFVLVPFFWLKRDLIWRGRWSVKDSTESPSHTKFPRCLKKDGLDQHKHKKFFYCVSGVKISLLEGKVTPMMHPNEQHFARLVHIWCAVGWAAASVVAMLLFSSVLFPPHSLSLGNYKMSFFSNLMRNSGNLTPWIEERQSVLGLRSSTWRLHFLCTQ